MVDKVNTRSMKRAWWIGALLVVFIALQFVRPGLTNPPVTAELNAPRSQSNPQELLLQLPLQRNEATVVRPGRTRLLAARERCEGGQKTS